MLWTAQIRIGVSRVTRPWPSPLLILEDLGLSFCLTLRGFAPVVGLFQLRLYVGVELIDRFLDLSLRSAWALARLP